MRLCFFLNKNSIEVPECKILCVLAHLREISIFRRKREQFKSEKSGSITVAKQQ